jgi:hypothetical protein
MKNFIVVTGGADFIGSNLISLFFYFLKTNYQEPSKQMSD